MDKDVLAAIFDRYAPCIYQYALHLWHEPIKADEVVGDVFSLLLEQLISRKEPTTSLRSHLYQIAYHLMVDRARHDNQLINIENAVDVSDEFVDLSVEVQIEECVLMQALEGSFKNNLNELEQHVIVLRFFEGFSIWETAMIINKRAKHVKAIRKRGVAKLRKVLHPHLQKDESDIS